MKKALLTTSWDDGHPLDFRVADLLSRYGLTGTFYIPQNAPTGTMSVAQMRDLASAFEIGSHTINHVFLDGANYHQARAEIFHSKTWVEDCLARPCPMFCPPGGKFSHRDIELIREAGYTALRSVELMSIDPPRDLGRGLKLLPTTIHAYPQPVRAYLKNAIKRTSPSNLWLYIIHGKSLKWTRLAERLIRRVADVGGVFHLWGHSWELQETRQWDRLDTVLRIMSQFKDRAPCVTNGELATGTSASGVLASASTETIPASRHPH
jgi:peptidoglycan/xylan/chitin deacetylase (PgdA/CDA1 family)